MFGLFRKQNKGEQVNIEKKAEADELFLRLDEAIDKLNRAKKPKDFFGNYKTAVDICAKILTFKLGDEYDNCVLNILHTLFGDKTEKTKSFLDRCSRSGYLSYSVDEIISHRDEMTAESYALFLELTGVRELEYTYVLVSFGGEKTYYYLCEYPEISIGDEVIVPVGNEEYEKRATVVSVEKFTYDTLPYPLSKIKKVMLIL